MVSYKLIRNWDDMNQKERIRAGVGFLIVGWAVILLFDHYATGLPLMKSLTNLALATGSLGVFMVILWAHRRRQERKRPSAPAPA